MNGILNIMGYDFKSKFVSNDTDDCPIMSYDLQPSDHDIYYISNEQISTSSNEMIKNYLWNNIAFMTQS